MVAGARRSAAVRTHGAEMIGFRTDTLPSASIYPPTLVWCYKFLLRHNEVDRLF